MPLTVAGVVAGVVVVLVGLAVWPPADDRGAHRARRRAARVCVLAGVVLVIAVVAKPLSVSNDNDVAARSSVSQQQVHAPRATAT